VRSPIRSAPIRTEGALAMFEEFGAENTVVVTTYRRDGKPVDTPMHIAVEGGNAFIRTYATALKWKRPRRNPQVVVSHATTGKHPALLGLLMRRRARPVGPGRPARAVVLQGEESEMASSALARKYPLLQGVVIPLMHRLVYRTETLNMGLRPE
jgi:PPOX class probable F420-dependent enzyme